MENEYNLDIVETNIRYREPRKREGKYFKIKLGNKIFGCTIDYQTLDSIDNIMKNSIEKRKFPNITNYVKYCLVKWTKIYLLITENDTYIITSFYDSQIIEKNTLSIIMHRFELDFIDLKNILSSSSDKKDKLIKFRDQFIGHLHTVLSLPRTNVDVGMIRHYIITDNTIRDIVNILEKEELISKGYIDTIQFKKNDMGLHVKQKDIQYGELIHIVTSHITVRKNEEQLLADTIYKILFDENENVIKEENRKFITSSDYTYMCIKEWTNIYKNIYDRHILNHRYILEIDNEKSLCDNYVNAIRKDRTLIPNLNDFHCEINLDRWFRKNYNIFGFTDIVRSNIKDTDYLCKYENRYFYIELEYRSGNFILHGHDSKSVNAVICYEKDVDLDIPVIPLLDLSKEIFT